MDEAAVNADAAGLYQLVLGLRPDYRTWRARWPLWTYDPASWSDQPSGFLGQLLFGPSLLQSAWKEWLPNIEVGGGEAYVPLLTRAYRYAVALQHNPNSSPTAEIVHQPDEAAELSGAFHDALFGKTGALPHSLVEDGEETLFRRLIRHRAQQLHGDATEESAEELGKELLRSVGLLAHGGSSTSLSNSTLDALDSEAREVVRGVVQAIADEGIANTVGFVVDLMDCDRAINLRPKERERVRRGTPRRALHIPFLTPGELSFLRDERDETEAKLAYRLVNNRLSGDLTFDSYRQKL